MPSFEGIRGDERVCVAVLDGPVKLSHPCFEGANIHISRSISENVEFSGSALEHGTHVASIIFGQDDTICPGLSPDCRGLIYPIFSNDDSGSIKPCSQIDIAQAIERAVESGANIINISGGQLAESAALNPLLAKSLILCAERNVLVVAAAGNDGCDCVHIPASFPSVIAVGSIGRNGRPMKQSNWGYSKIENGILAPGEHIRGAGLEDNISYKSGTSYAAPIVSGVLALMLSLQIKKFGYTDPLSVRNALFSGATKCNALYIDDCKIHMEGTLDALSILKQLDLWRGTMDDISDIHLSNAATEPKTEPRTPISKIYVSTVDERIEPSDCGCGCGGKKETTCSCSKSTQDASLVFAIGHIDYEYVSESRKNSLQKLVSDGSGNPLAGIDLLDFLDKPENEYLTQSFVWTLKIGGFPVYAIQPTGAYDSLRD
ncbi:S8 family serine peptidase [Rhizobium redzepovicii]